MLRWRWYRLGLVKVWPAAGEEDRDDQHGGDVASDLQLTYKVVHLLLVEFEVLAHGGAGLLCREGNLLVILFLLDGELADLLA